MNNKKDYTYYLTKFIQLLQQNAIVTDTDGNTFHLQDEKNWKQVYDEHITSRSIFPHSWFLSSGEVDKVPKLINIAYTSPRWLKRNIHGADKVCYKPKLIIDGTRKTKNLEEHNLVALVYPELAEAYGKAKELIEEKGVLAFGKEEDNAHGHHKAKYSKSKDNSASNIQPTMKPVHEFITHKIPSPNATLEEEIAFMRAFGKLAAEQEPNKPTILLTNHRYDPKTLEYIGNNDTISIHSFNNNNDLVLVGVEMVVAHE